MEQDDRIFIITETVLVKRKFEVPAYMAKSEDVFHKLKEDETLHESEAYETEDIQTVSVRFEPKVLTKEEAYKL